MAVKFLSATIVTLGLTCLSPFIYVSCVELNKPHIFNTSYEEILINANEDYTLQCEADIPIRWSFDRVFFQKNVSFSTITEETYRNYNYYGTKLIIQNASYIDTGFYYCHAVDSSREDESRSSHVYLYVTDDNELSANPYDSETSVIPVNAPLKSMSVIPCRPTSPVVLVELFITDQEPSNKVKFDPKIGFTVKVDSDGDYYECVYRKGNITNSEIYYFVPEVPLRDYIDKPKTEDINEGHSVVGQNIVLKCSTAGPLQQHLWVDFPTDRGNETFSRTNDPMIENNILTIYNITKKDEGYYTCRAKYYNLTESDTIFVKVYDVNEHFINLTEANDIYHIAATASDKEVQWRIDIVAHPVPSKIIWINNMGKEITDNNKDKYNITTNRSSQEAFLKIKNININDFGLYTLKVSNKYEEKSLILNLTVTDKPTVFLQSDVFHMIGELSRLKCIVVGYPTPVVRWKFKPCLDDSCFAEDIVESNSIKNGLQITSYLKMKAAKSGIIQCLAVNSEGNDNFSIQYNVTDVKNGFNVWSDDEEINPQNNITTIAFGESVKIYCAASVYLYSDQLFWYNAKDSTRIENIDKFTIERSHTIYSNKITMTINDASKENIADYNCTVREIFGKKQLKSMLFPLNVIAPEKPVIFKTNLNNSQADMNLPYKLSLFCYSHGRPRPTVTWYKDDQEIVNFPDDRRHFLDNKNLIYFNSTDEADEGVYSCRVKNKEGEIRKTLSVQFKNKVKQKETILIITIVTFTSLLIIMAIVVWIFARKQRRKIKRLKDCGLANFEKGDLECMNPELGIDDQAELLPYNKNKWEFSREDLKLGKQLGSGAFGIVLKAEAKGIVETGVTTNVAVKMVKKNTDYSYIKALASELKIMAHLGQNLNVVNLLGACTNNVAKRELLVIVEYCRFGNLHNYLLRHRESFIDQIDKKSGMINYYIGQDILDRTYSISSNRSNSHSSPSSPYNKLSYAALLFSNSNSEGNGNIVPTATEITSGTYNYTGASNCTNSTTVCMTPTGDEYPNSNMQPEWRSNYKGDYRGEVRPICTKELLVWSFQVVRGMEYLSSRKVLHGDLAARNILLAENNIVKICDFGLAKTMYKDDNYKKTGDGPLPVKWMAIESIRDRVFSTQSDVWSFGIVLWEFFSLAKTPYPGMEADERLYQKLVEGYRMESPKYATNDIHQIMVDCWHANPLCRPSFEQLGLKLGALLEEGVRQHYIDLNDPYLKMNTQRIEDGESDYLKMFSPPTFENLSSPNYINEDVTQISPEGYLVMKQHVFSPRYSADENIFNFDVNKKRQNADVVRPSGPGHIELRPMLGGQNGAESDIESPASPLPTESFSNPSYNLAPVIKEINDSDTTDKSDKVTELTPRHSNHYVNSASRDWEKIVT